MLSALPQWLSRPLGLHGFQPGAFRPLWIFCVLLPAVGCGGGGAHGDADAGYEHVYTVRARVTKLPDGSPGGQFIAHHETIPDYVAANGSIGMRHMVMPFTITDPAVLEGVAEGDIVEITFGETHRPRVRQGVLEIKQLPGDTELVLSDPPEYRPLIGEGLGNWVVAPAELAGHWSLADGVIAGQSDDRLGSILWTADTDYTDFEIVLEYQTDSEDYDSGVFLRGDSHQVQIGISGSMKRDMTACIYAPADGRGGYPVELDAEKIAKHHRLGQWNTLRIIVQGKRIQTFLNGGAFVDYEAETIPAVGPIGLQLHANREMLVRFRDIRVRALE